MPENPEFSNELDSNATPQDFTEQFAGIRRLLFEQLADETIPDDERRELIRAANELRRNEDIFLQTQREGGSVLDAAFQIAQRIYEERQQFE